MTLKRLATIGYEGASVEDFLATLKAAGVTTLLDVREFAGSRRKGFAKTALRENLASVGIHYRHEPALGSPRDIRHQLREDGRHDRFFRDFDRYLATQQPLLKQLAGELTGTVALLCYERDFRECHRKSVAAALGLITGLTPSTTECNRMILAKHVRTRVRILVKAFPQHSEKYEETVCCAGVTDDHRLIRLYPITYRRLAKEHQFNRYDQIQALATKASNDTRPESYRVDHDSIQVTERGKLTEEAKVRLWQPHITTSLAALQDEHRTVGRSLGIIRPDPGSLKFLWKDAEQEDQDDTRSVQASLFEAPLRPLKPPELTFFYRYTSGGNEHTQSIQDWEVQATFLNYQREYGSRDKALAMMAQEYGQNIPARNLHFIMGNMAKRPWQFIIIGLLRSGLDPAELAKQGTLI